MTSAAEKTGILRQFLAGAAMLGRGFGVWRTAPGLMLLGIVPAFIVAALFVAGFIALGLNLETIVISITPFASEWTEPFRSGLRVFVGLAFVVVAVLFIINAFTAVTLIVGQPFYERIWKHVESRGGTRATPPDVGFWEAALRGVVDGIRMLVPTVLAGAALFALGFIPVVGTILAAVLGALVGGWFLAVELTGPAFESRGKSLTERRRILRASRPMATGFGLASYLVFLIPLGAVIMMPVAVAGAATLSGRLLSSETDPGAGPVQTTS
ncbi:EI24 domain-containing protein [Salinibacterium sp. G-O1]|uniref:EI24 domain-containing protein n=1 Tax=Salinibacterium sp. G-O1 TaxID=3046208 RepID=UPI0024B9A426|nr:EI24 domain-containing protein [Salinibacterium sp. G-O1]MDJ0335227.1 EI24 domain-containing protein [Salinibacterium sp. G-O1]